MATTPEGKIKKKLDAMLKGKGKALWSFPPQAGPYGSAGIPDRIACIAGHFVGIEAKADKTKKPTALQLQKMKMIEAAGGKCFVVYDDVTLAELEAYIDRWIN